MTRPGFLAPACAAMALLAGCVAGPDYERPAPPASAALASGKFVRGADAVAEAPLAQWWRTLADPTLDKLIEQGLAAAPSLEAARARVRQAREGIAAARADRLPVVSGSAIYARADLPADAIGGATGDIDLFNLGFDAQWEADLAGLKGRTLEQRMAQAQAAEASLADAQVALSAEIARLYVTWRAAQSGKAILERKLAHEERLVTLEQRRFAGGTIPRQPVEAAHIRVSRTQAMIEDASAQGAIALDGLAVAVGLAPGELAVPGEGAVPLPPAQVAVGDPAAMLARRPDVRAAERRLAASSAGIGIAEARKYPQISFMGIVGLGGDDPGDAFESSNLSTIMLPRLSWNFLNFGRVAAGVRGAEAGRDAALADYRAAMLMALGDAERSLASFGAARLALARAREQLGHAEKIAALEAMRARAGTISERETLDARTAVVDAQLQAARARTELAIAYIALHKALGIGWSDQLS